MPLTDMAENEVDRLGASLRRRAAASAYDLRYDPDELWRLKADEDEGNDPTSIVMDVLNTLPKLGGSYLAVSSVRGTRGIVRTRVPVSDR